MNRKIAAALSALTLTAACAAVTLTAALPAFAEDAAPVPKMFRGMQKGQWKVDMETMGASKSGRALPAMNVCTDNPMNHSSSGPTPRPEMSCKRRLLKDTADEAVMETVCPELKSTVSMKRESAKVMLVEMNSTGTRGPHSMKMRYTYLGACREGQGAVSYDKNSEQCVKLRAQAAKMDPAKSCARNPNRDDCEQRLRDRAAKMTAMCN